MISKINDMIERAVDKIRMLIEILVILTLCAFVLHI